MYGGDEYEFWKLSVDVSDENPTGTTTDYDAKKNSEDKTFTVNKREGKKQTYQAKAQFKDNYMTEGTRGIELHESDVKSIFPFASRTNILLKRPISEIGMHKAKVASRSIEEKPSSSKEDEQTLHKPLTNMKKENVTADCNINTAKKSQNFPSVTIARPLLKELEKSGIFIPDTETADTRPEPVINKTHIDLNETLNVRNDSRNNKSRGVSIECAIEAAEEVKLNDDPEKEKTSANEEEKIDTAQESTTSVINEALKYFDKAKNYGFQYLSYGRNYTKKEEKKPVFQQNFPKPDFQRHSPGHHGSYKTNDIKTLGDAIRFFCLSSFIEELERSLEDVRRNRKKKEDHEDYFKQIDKEIQKMSLTHHPDRVRNRGGTEAEIETSQKLQTAINVTRSVLKVLNAAFLEDIGTDHKFGFYTMMSISSLANEDEIKCRIYEVIFKIGVISRIKQQNIISEIRKFLIESKKCVNSYLVDSDEFEKHRDNALLHLKYCVKGYKKLSLELKEAREQSKLEKNNESMYRLLQSMARDSERDLEILKQLKKTAKTSVKGNYRFFSPETSMDPYFVLPFVTYTNLLLMCNVMKRSSSIWDKLHLDIQLPPRYHVELCYLMHPHYLASYCSGNKYHESVVMEIMGKTQRVEKVHISKEEIKAEFNTLIKNINVFLEYQFKIEDYNEAMTTNLLVLDLKNCMKMMTDFQEKKQELSKGIKDFQKKTQKMDEKFDKFDKMMQETDEMNQKVKERLEKNKELSEKVASALSDMHKE